MIRTGGRKTTYVVLWSLFLLSKDTFAGMAGNIANFPEKGKLAVGYEYTKVDNRRITEYDAESGGFAIIDSSERSLGRISYGAWENIALDFLLGRATLNIEDAIHSGDPGLKFDSGNTWGLGIRVKLFENLEKNLVTGAGFQYQHFSNDNAIRYYPDDPFSCKSEEWHVSVDAGRRLNKYILLYASMRYSEITLPYTHADPQIPRIGGFKERDNMGIAVGAEIKLAKKISLSLEKRFADEDAYTVGLHYIF